MKPMLPNTIFSGNYKEGHIQGIAVDTERGFVYYSFTTILLKTDLAGNPLGVVNNLAGHLGCIAYDKERNLIWGSLELKHDAIGKGITDRIGRELAEEDSFYLVAFDCAKIDRMELDAEKDGIMGAVYLREVAEDYAETDEVCQKPHRYGCSGIDGVSLGPVFGEAPDSPQKIMVAYGVYGDTEREDNDYQVLLQYDPEEMVKCAHPLDQSSPHHVGPKACEARYFFYTGNTRYGIQNLEYDPYSGNWLVAVYCGKKETFVNFPLFVIDGKKSPALLPLEGRGGEEGLVLTSAKLGEAGKDSRIFGSFFPYGATGIASLGDGRFYFSHNGAIREERIFYSHLNLYRYNPDSPALFDACADEA